MTETSESTSPDRHEPGRVAIWLVLTWCVLTAIAEAALFGSILGAYARTWQDHGEAYVIGATLSGLWLLCLVCHWLARYYPPEARGPRRSGLIVQTVLIAIVTAAGWSRSGAWDGILILILASPAVGMWEQLIMAYRLHPSDLLQVALALREERSHQRSVQDARNMRIRQAQLNAAMGSLGLTASATATVEPPREYVWDIPKGKHGPLVYFLALGDRVKIGTTTELRRRIRTLALRPEHVALLLDGGADVEKSFHARFGSLREGTTEWFKNTGELSAYIAEANALADAKQEV